MTDDQDQPLSEDWLKQAGFKWHEFERQNGKHWLLWLGHAIDSLSFNTYEDLGIEVANGSYRGPDLPDGWFCWLRSDSAGRYHRFIHIRTLVTPRDLVKLIEGITGTEFDPNLCRGGSLLTPELAERYRRADERTDRILMRSSHPWSDIETDDTRGRALPEHIEAAVKVGKAK